VGKNIELIIFDWDDVFTSGSTEGYFKCYHQALSEVGVSLTAEEEKKRIYAKWGQSHREELRELLKENPDLLDEACEIYERNLFGNTFVDCLSVIPGSREILFRLRQKYLLAVATGANSTILRERVFPKFDFPDVFAQIISAYDLADGSMSKPDPYMVNQILSAQSICPEHTILVGDAKNDVLMALAAQVTPVVVLSGHLNAEEAKEMGVKLIIPDVSHLEAVLEKENDGG
jgi:phosphoglycolate phosphatase-like HAD superfamily hydrolase